MLGRTFFYGFVVAMVLFLVLLGISCISNGYDMNASADSYVIYPLVGWLILIGVLCFIEAVYAFWTGKTFNIEDRVLRKLGFQIDEIDLDAPSCGPYL